MVMIKKSSYKNITFIGVAFLIWMIVLVYSSCVSPAFSKQEMISVSEDLVSSSQASS